MRNQQLQQWALTLPQGACVADALAQLAAQGLDVDAFAGFAVFGERVQRAHVLDDGARLELLQALLIDPKQARRQRAEARLAQRQVQKNHSTP